MLHAYFMSHQQKIYLTSAQNGVILRRNVLSRCVKVLQL